MPDNKWLQTGHVAALIVNTEEDAQEAIKEFRAYSRAKCGGLSNNQWDCLQWVADGKPVFGIETDEPISYWQTNTIKSLEDRGFIEIDIATDGYRITSTGLEILKTRHGK